MKLFSDEEIKNEYYFPNNELPLISDCLKYAVNRKGRQNHVAVVGELAELIHEIWMNTDCCPLGIRCMKRKFNEHVWVDYCKLTKQGSPGRKHRAKPKVSKEPTRRSSRNENAADGGKDLTVMVHDPVVDEVPPEKKLKLATSTRSKDSERNDFRNNWDNFLMSKQVIVLIWIFTKIRKATDPKLCLKKRREETIN